MICVYVAIGQKSSAVARVVDQVRRHGAPDRTIFVVASPAAAPGLQWIAPFAGFTMAEYFRDGGGHAVVVLDDLTKHAARSEEHTSELQSLMRSSYAVFCLKKKNNIRTKHLTV